MFIGKMKMIKIKVILRIHEFNRKTKTSKPLPGPGNLIDNEDKVVKQKDNPCLLAAYGLVKGAAIE